MTQTLNCSCIQSALYMSLSTKNYSIPKQNIVGIEPKMGLIK